MGGGRGVFDGIQNSSSYAEKASADRKVKIQKRVFEPSGFLSFCGEEVVQRTGRRNYQL